MTDFTTFTNSATNDTVPGLLPRQNENQIITKNERFQNDDFKKMIRSMGLKITDQRMLILRCMHDADVMSGERHVTAQELFEKVAAVDSGVGFATVYRFLRNLAEKSFVTEVRMGGQPSRYELTSQEHHDHLTCTKCGKICEFENEKIEKLQAQVAEHFGFVLTSHILELYGVCPSCQAHPRLK
ncbi:MAG: transcriptional repressor [Bdellovibrio sp.]|nr:transcriptional repressor [Bdellovibrio sp.]